VNAKVGSAETRLRLKHLHFFFHFGIHFFGSAKAELQLGALLRSPSFYQYSVDI
jgi:hypothetical protein